MFDVSSSNGEKPGFFPDGPTPQLQEKAEKPGFFPNGPTPQLQEKAGFLSVPGFSPNGPTPCQKKPGFFPLHKINSIHFIKQKIFLFSLAFFEKYDKREKFNHSIGFMIHEGNFEKRRTSF